MVVRNRAWKRIQVQPKLCTGRCQSGSVNGAKGVHNKETVFVSAAFCLSVRKWFLFQKAVWERHEYSEETLNSNLKYRTYEAWSCTCGPYFPQRSSFKSAKSQNKGCFLSFHETEIGFLNQFSITVDNRWRLHPSEAKLELLIKSWTACLKKKIRPTEPQDWWTIISNSELGLCCHHVCILFLKPPQVCADSNSKFATSELSLTYLTSNGMSKD